MNMSLSGGWILVTFADSGRYNKYRDRRTIGPKDGWLQLGETGRLLKTDLSSALSLSEAKSEADELW